MPPRVMGAAPGCSVIVAAVDLGHLVSVDLSVQFEQLAFLVQMGSGD